MKTTVASKEISPLSPTILRYSRKRRTMPAFYLFTLAAAQFKQKERLWSGVTRVHAYSHRLLQRSLCF